MHKFQVGDRVECTLGYGNLDGPGPFTGWRGTVRSLGFDDESSCTVTWDPIGRPRSDCDDMCAQYRLALFSGDQSKSPQSKSPRHYSSMLIDLVDDGTIDPAHLVMTCIHYMSEEQVYDMIKTSGYDWLLELEEKHNIENQ